MNRRFFLKTLSIFLILLFSVQNVCIGASSDSEVFEVSPIDSSNNQDNINSVIDAASDAGGGTVYLNAGVYEVTGPVIIRSNIRLTGDPNAIIKVSASSSQWATGSTGVISCSGSIQNVEIFGFQINGNLGSLPAAYANTPGHDKDCFRCIILHGDSGNYANNILVHDMKLYDSFSDGMYIYYARNVQCYNNFISNTQHEGIFWSVVIGGEMYNNQIAGITSDCARLDNCINCRVHDNVLFSYDGDNTNGAYKHGENGLQVGNAGSSHGYDASNKPTTTTNIEIFNNTFANNGLNAILMGSGSDNNVYIHDNKFIGHDELKTMGIPVDGFDYNNMPTKEMSKKVFDTIFDILDTEFTESGKTNQSLDSITYRVPPKTKDGVMGGIKVLGFKDIVVIDKVPYIESNDSILIKSAVMSTPNPELWNGWISDKDENVDISYSNNSVTATLTVKSKTYDYKKNNLTGKKERITKKTKTAVFNDSYSPAPRILNQPENITGIIYVYPTSFQVYVPSDGLVKVNYKYIWNESEHQLLSGVRNQTKEGVKFTEYTHVNRWTGDLDHQGDWINVMGEFNPKMLNVTVDTPYKHIPVTKFNIIYKPFAKRTIAGWFYPFIAILIIVFLYIRGLLRDQKRY
jgi:hypothetical protein